MNLENIFVFAVGFVSVFESSPTSTRFVLQNFTNGLKSFKHALNRWASIPSFRRGLRYTHIHTDLLKQNIRFT